VAFRPDRSGFIETAHPYVERIDGRVMADWCTAAAHVIPKGSPCYIETTVDAGRTAGTRPVRCSSVAPGIRTTEAPTKGLSTFNNMAFGLAVYASQCGLSTPHARLASSRWSDTTGRAFHPQGSNERFQGPYNISSPIPKLAWRNRIDRSVGEPRCARRCRRTEARSSQPTAVCATDPCRIACASATYLSPASRVLRRHLMRGIPTRPSRNQIG
jgi:hypothetical protein